MFIKFTIIFDSKSGSKIQTKTYISTLSITRFKILDSKNLIISRSKTFIRESLLRNTRYLLHTNENVTATTNAMLLAMAML